MAARGARRYRAPRMTGMDKAAQAAQLESKRAGHAALYPRVVATLSWPRRIPGTGMASHSGSGDAGQAKGRNGDALEAELQRLAAERNAALAHQAATSEILKIIAASPGDTQPVFQAIAESARRLSGAMSAAVTTVADEMIRLAAFTSSDEAGALAFRQASPRRPLRAACTASC